MARGEYWGICRLLRHATLAVMLVALNLGAAHAQATPAETPLSAALQCLQAGAVAEQRYKLPVGLLAAIGRVESGRSDIAGGVVLAWPWSINAEGHDHIFASKAVAMREVAQLFTQGMRSIDVGCFQINLLHHPDAFTSLTEAFDPQANADYAARFLVTLLGRQGGWPGAISAYHSSTPELADAYRARVYASWIGSAAPAAQPAPGARSPATPQIIAGLPPIRGGAAVVWSVAAQSMGMRVWTAVPQPPGQTAARPIPAAQMPAPRRMGQPATLAER